jgi:hypothetical protein|tara:strand:+ start:1148 stop:1606 length:459 start_codon:yes stop_codon:yes gene_type:complete
MAHFAELNSDNEVIRVVVISNDDVIANGGDYSSQAETFVSNLIPHSENGVAWKQTSYNSNQRKQYAGLGYTYDETKNKFILPKPFDSWSLDSNDDWIAPVTYPSKDEIESNPVLILWDEDNQKWLGKTYTGENLQTETDYEWDASGLSWSEV